MDLEGPHRGHQHHRRGLQSRHAALDVQEFLRAQIRAEAGLGHHVVRQLQGHAGGDDRVAAVGDIGEGAAVDKGGGALQRLHQIGLQGVLQQRRHGAHGLQVARGHGFVVVGIAHDDAGKPLLQICNGRGKAEHRHDLAGHGDVKAVLPGGAVGLAAQAVHHEAQLAVVHIHAALPGDPAGIDAQGIALLNMVVQHGRQQVVGRADGVEVAGKMQVDVLHGHHLSIPAAGRAALDAEHRPQGRLPKGHQSFLPMRRRPSVRPTVVVVLPSPAGVGVMAVTRISLPSSWPVPSVTRARVDLGLVVAVGFHTNHGKMRGGDPVGLISQPGQFRYQTDKP